MTILGYDIDGQPLRAGDRVVFVDCFPRSKGDPVGKSGSIVGLWDRGLDTDIPDPSCPGNTFWGLGCHFRKLPPKQADNETTTWESIEQLTGWVPEGVRV